MTHSVHNYRSAFYIMLILEILWYREMISPPLTMEYPPVCMLSVFVPVHFWSSLKHLFSRCWSWQALHDIKSEILTVNQTASRPMAASIHRLFFAVQICIYPFFLFWTCNPLCHGTNYYHNWLCFCPLSLPLTQRLWPPVRAAWVCPSSTCLKLGSSCLSILQKGCILTRLKRAYLEVLYGEVV